MAKAAPSVAPYIGSKISLITTSNIRYEGTLYTLDRKESTIAVKDVRSFGTESRKVSRQVEQSNEIYDLIIFRGQELEDLTVLEEAKAVEKDNWDSMWSNGDDPDRWKSMIPVQNNNASYDDSYFNSSNPASDALFRGARDDGSFGCGFANRTSLNNGYSAPLHCNDDFAMHPFAANANARHTDTAFLMQQSFKDDDAQRLAAQQQQQLQQQQQVAALQQQQVHSLQQQHIQQQVHSLHMNGNVAMNGNGRMKDSSSSCVGHVFNVKDHHRAMDNSAHWVQAQVEHNGAHGEHNGTQEHNSQNAQNTQLWLNNTGTQDRWERWDAPRTTDTVEADKEWRARERVGSERAREWRNHDWESEMRNAKWRGSGAQGRKLTPPQQSSSGKDRAHGSPHSAHSIKSHSIPPMYVAARQSMPLYAAAIRQSSPMREVTSSTRTTVTTTSSPVVESKTPKLLNGVDLGRPKLRARTPVGRSSLRSDVATVVSSCAPVGWSSRRDEKSKERRNDDGRKDVKRGGRKFSSLNDVFNFHHGSEAVLLEQLCQHGTGGWSARQLRALSERSPLVYHVYLDFVNFCCPQNNTMDDETLWEKFADATRKTFEQHYQQAEANASRLTSPRQSDQGPYTPNSCRSGEVKESPPPNGCRTTEDFPPLGERSTVAPSQGQIPSDRSGTNAPTLANTKHDSALARRNPTLADFASKKDVKRGKAKDKLPAGLKPLPAKKKITGTTGGLRVGTGGLREGAQKLRREDGSWNCPRCTLRNEAFLLECAACACPLEHASTLSEFPPLGS